MKEKVQLLERFQAIRRENVHNPKVYWAMTAAIDLLLDLNDEAVEYDLQAMREA